MCPVSGPGRLGFDQILWINKKNMKRKFLGLLECVQHWGKLKGKMMCIRVGFLKGLQLCFRRYILSGPLVWAERSLSFDPWPWQGGIYCCKAFTRHSGRGGSMPRGWIREHWNSVVRLTSYFWSLQATSGVISSKANHYILVVSWLWRCLSLISWGLKVSVIIKASFLGIWLQFYLKEMIT